MNQSQVFKEELEWAYYLGVPSVFGPELSKGSNSNYAGIVSAFISRKFNSPVRLSLLFHFVSTGFPSISNARVNRVRSCTFHHP